MGVSACGRSHRWDLRGLKHLCDHTHRSHASHMSHPVLAGRARLIGRHAFRPVVRYSFNDAISITNRYFTWPLMVRSQASLICWIGITSTSDVMPCSAQ